MPAEQGTTLPFSRGKQPPRLQALRPEEQERPGTRFPTLNRVLSASCRWLLRAAGNANPSRRLQGTRGRGDGIGPQAGLLTDTAPRTDGHRGPNEPQANLPRRSVFTTKPRRLTQGSVELRFYGENLTGWEVEDVLFELQLAAEEGFWVQGCDAFHLAGGALTWRREGVRRPRTQAPEAPTCRAPARGHESRPRGGRPAREPDLCPHSSS